MNSESLTVISATAQASPDLKAAFKLHERKQRLTNIKVSCILVIVLMPAGSSLDYFIYPDKLGSFFQARLLCSALTSVILALLFTNWGKKASPYLSMAVALLPVTFMAWMIQVTEGFNSPYYAGINLIPLAVGAVLHWTFLESLIAVILVLLIYIGAGLTNHTVFNSSTVFNNFYFIALMDVIVVVGSIFQYRQRFREFTLRHELDLNKQELEESNAKLVELDRIKSRFFGNISHELRTPLTLLLAPLESMLLQARKQFDDKTQSLLSTMQANGMRLLKLINDLLDLVRLESGVIQIKREPVNVHDFLNGLAGAAQQMAEDKEINLQTRLSPEVDHVMLDRDKLEKVILNLQFNSLKFTPRGGSVTLESWREKDILVLRVSDTGMGMPAKQLPHIFDRFWQADDSSKRKYQGVGIGLSLVKELVEAHDGSVTVTSEVNVGTTFTIHLPYLEGSPTPVDSTTTTQAAQGDASPALLVAAASAPPTSPATQTDPQETDTTERKNKGTVSNQEWLSELYRRAELFPTMQSQVQASDPKPPAQDSVQSSPSRSLDGTRPEILIADDEFGMRQFIRSQLEDDFRIVEAKNGQEAVEKSAQGSPQLILLDMMMPEKDGLQACKEIREIASTKNTPIVMLTARADEEIKLAALEAGASDFLSKPFSTTELQVRINNLVKSFSYQRDLAQKNETLETTIHQLKNAKTKLVETEKLASLGRMSAGIIHEINNPLNFATTGLFTLRKLDRSIQEEEREDYREIIKDVEEGLNRVKTIVTDLRSFSHHDDMHRESIDVRGIFTSSLRFLSHEWKDTIIVEQDVEEDLLFEANRNRLIQVLVNLMQNAIDSMNSKEYQNEKPTLHIKGWKEDGLCRLSIRDNGTGIKQEDQDKIFDPFFTTKDVGEGMGLGLSICYRIIQDYEGKVEVLSEPGLYCEFKLDFPCSN